MKTTLLSLILVLFALPCSFGQLGTDSLSQNSKKYLEFRKADANVMESMKEAGLNPYSSLYRCGKNGRYMFFLNGEPLECYKAGDLINTNADAYKLYSEGIEKIEKVRKREKTALGFIMAGLGANIITGVVKIAGESVPPAAYVVEGGLMTIGLSLGVSSLVSSPRGKKMIKKATDIYNTGLSTSYILPEPELKFGFTGNGLGMVINF